MPTAVIDAFGNTIQACSISTAVKAKFPKNSFPSEAAWSKHVKADAFNTLRAKIKAGEVPKNTVVGRTTTGQKMVYKGGDSLEISMKLSSGTVDKFNISLSQYDQTMGFHGTDWDFGPNMAKMAQAEKLIVNSPAQLKKYLSSEDMDVEIGDVVLVAKNEISGKNYNVKFDGYDGNLDPEYTFVLDEKLQFPYSHQQLQTLINTPDYSVTYKVGQKPPDLPTPHGLPVSSTSTSKGALTNEDAATMFVKTKDKLAQEAGINIKGASGKLDELVYKTIADQAGYTPAEMLAKVEAYKGSGKKLSALKKKVLPKSGDGTKYANDASVNKATAAVKKEELKPEEVVLVWDDEAVAKAYIKAKDHVVATNDQGWTLYTKNDQFDAEINKWMQADLGPIKKETADVAIANYIATTQKLSVLKKQMIKKGELVPKADTLKTSGGKKVVNKPEIDSIDSLLKWVDETEDLKPGDLLATINLHGITHELKFHSFGTPGNPIFKVGGTTYTKSMVEHNLFKNADAEFNWKIGGKPKPAPGETGAGQVGKKAQDPKKVGPKQTLTAEQEHDAFLQWEGLNLPISSSGAKIVAEAKSLAQKYGLGEDILPILRAVDKGKTAKFGFSPEQNKFLYEKKAVEEMKNPTPVYKPPQAKAPIPDAVYGELPEDSSIFQDMSPQKFHSLWEKGMRTPSYSQQGAIRAYSGSTYHDINGHMRAGKSVTTHRLGREIQSSMSPLPMDLLVRRGTSLSGVGVHSYEELIANVGKNFTEPAFSSTAVGGSGQFSGQVNLVIQAPKGTQASWFKPYSGISGENELTLSAGTEFQILKVEMRQGNWGSQTAVVHVRVVGQPKP